MSINTKQILDAARPFTKSNELVSYLVGMIDFYQAELQSKIQFMRARMDVLQNVVDGHEGFQYQMRSDIGGTLGNGMDIIQAHIFEMTTLLVIVLRTQCSLTLEW